MGHPDYRVLDPVKFVRFMCDKTPPVQAQRLLNAMVKRIVNGVGDANDSAVAEMLVERIKNAREGNVPRIT